MNAPEKLCPRRPQRLEYSQINGTAQIHKTVDIDCFVLPVDIGILRAESLTLFMDL